MNANTREYVTDLGMTVTDHGDEIVMQTAPAKVLPFDRSKSRNLEWLMRDVASTPYAEVLI